MRESERGIKGYAYVREGKRGFVSERERERERESVYAYVMETTFFWKMKELDLI